MFGELPEIRQFDGHDWFSTKTSRRNLPHWELRGSTYFITMRVHSEIGKPFFDSKLAQLVISTLLKYHERKYFLHAYVVMPDHLHIILKPIYNHKLSAILKTLKGSTAYEINRLLQRTGKFWQTENFDHLIRDAISLREKWNYVKENPVKAQLVKKAEDYPFSSFYSQTNCRINPAKTCAD